MVRVIVSLGKMLGHDERLFCLLLRFLNIPSHSLGGSSHEVLLFSNDRLLAFTHALFGFGSLFWMDKGSGLE